MPTYDYRCSACGHTEEITHKITEEPRRECPHCKAHAMQRGPGGGIALHFHGDGFYITDYSKKSSPSGTLPASSPQQQSGGCCPCGKNSSCSSGA